MNLEKHFITFTSSDGLIDYNWKSDGLDIWTDDQAQS